MGCLELGLKYGNFYNIDVGAGYGCGSAEDENFRNAYFQATMASKLDNKYCDGPKKFYWIMPCRSHFLWSAP